MKDVQERKISLMPRKVQPKLVGSSFEEYKARRYEESSLTKTLAENYEGDNTGDEFSDRLQFLIDTVLDMSTAIDAIKVLWTELLIRIKTPDFERLSHTQYMDILPLVSITGEASLAKVELEEIDNQLQHTIDNFFISQFELVDNEFPTYLGDYIYWHNEHLKYSAYWGIGVQYAEISKIESLYNNNIAKFESIRSTHPALLINFIALVKIYYSQVPKDYQVKFSKFSLQMSLDAVHIARNAGIFVNYKGLLQDYYQQHFQKQPWKNWIFKNVVGYGEDPWRLIFIFLIVNIIYLILFLIFKVDFHFQISISGYFDKVMSLFYFNNCTMLTAGYGDVYPKSISAKILTNSLQLMGFTITTVAFALFLRKVFRH